MNQTSPLVLVCTWFSRLVWLNLLWWLGTLLGGVVFGVFPATTSVLRIMRRYLNGSGRITFVDFLMVFRSELITANRSVFPLFLITISLSWYLIQAVQYGNQTWQLMSLMLLPLLAFNCLFLISVLIQTSLFNGSVKQTWRLGIAMIQNMPLLPISMLLGIIICLLCGLFVPVLLLLFSVSPACLGVMAWYLYCFPEYKQ